MHFKCVFLFDAWVYKPQHIKYPTGTHGLEAPASDPVHGIKYERLVSVTYNRKDLSFSFGCFMESK